MILLKDSKIIRYNDTTPNGIYFLPFELNSVQFTINVNLKTFYILNENRLFLFEIVYKNHQIYIKSIDSDIKHSFL